MAKFRIHFDDGSKVVVSAETPEQARKMARVRSPAPITKIKVVKSDESEAA